MLGGISFIELYTLIYGLKEDKPKVNLLQHEASSKR